MKKLFVKGAEMASGMNIRDVRDEVENYCETHDDDTNDPGATDEEKIELAQTLLQGAVKLMKEVVKNGDGKYASEEAYIVDHLQIIASANHGFLGRDKNLDDWLEAIREEEEAE